RRVPRGRHQRDQAPPGAPSRRGRPARLRPHPPAADDPAGHSGGMTTLRAREPGWADVLADHAAEDATARRLIAQLGACEAAALLEWAPVLTRAGVRVSAVRVAQAYLELAVLVRALEGLADAARVDAAPDRSSLWAGLFDLRENLVERAAQDLRALAA